MEESRNFNYSEAFRRNIGLVSEAEQVKLGGICVALPGLGGVGGAHLQTLARMGVGAFKLADPDTFEVANFNRQLGANLSTVGQSKTDAMARMAKDINPDARISTFPDGINAQNIDAFLEGVDVVVDGIEYFRIEVRELLYKACRERRIPVVNAGPIGFGAAVIVFTPDSPSFEEYFRISPEMTRAEKLLAMALGLGPGARHDIDSRYVDVEREKGPALASACMLCAAAAATEVLKLVTGRGRLSVSGRGIYFDPLRGRTLNLRGAPSLTRTLRGRFIRWVAFRRLESLRRMHDREVAERAAQSERDASFSAAASA